MSMPVRPTDGVAELNDNAKPVISKRYLIKDASGKVRFARGQKLDEATLYNWDWAIEGVSGLKAS